MVPPYDPVDLARAIESAANRPTNPPPFDPSSYARIVDATIVATSRAPAQVLPTVKPPCDTPRTMTASPVVIHAIEETTEVETLARAMYASYLESDFPEALVLAEHVVEKQPDHALAQAVVSRCRSVLGDTEAKRLEPSSIVRLKPGVEAASLPFERFEKVDARSLVVLAHVDGEIDAATLATLAGISRVEALEHLHALLDEGILEVVA